MNIHHNSALLIALIAFVLLFGANYSGATLSYDGIVYNGQVKGFAINAVHNKLYVARLVDPQVLVFDLWPDSGTLKSSAVVQSSSCTTGGIIYVSMALDVMKQKLYVGTDTGHLYVYSLTDTGTLILPPAYYSLAKTGGPYMGNMYVDFIDNLLVWSGYYPAVPQEYYLSFNRLNADGTVQTDTTLTYRTNYDNHWVAVADMTNRVLYSGAWGRYGYRVNLDASGFPLLASQNYNSIGGDANVTLDAANKRLYFCKLANSTAMWKLDGAGVEIAFDSFTHTVPERPLDYATAMAIDASRRRIFIGGEYNTAGFLNFIGYYNMDADGKPSSCIDTGLDLAGGASYPYAMAYEPFYNKVYVGTYNSKILVYNAPDSPMTPVKINDGESLTEIPNITLKFQHSNPNFIYVSGDILSIGSPVNTKNQWISCGGGFWKNAEDTMRAVTLNVPATLSSGVGEKTIEVWYCGSTTGFGMCSNFTGMMRKATAKITLIESSASVLSLSLSRIDYDGCRIDYTVKDGRDRNVSVAIQYKTSTKDWSDAAQGTGGEELTELSATLAGTAHYFIWDNEKDIGENAKDVQIRIKADNGDSQGVWTESTKYSVPDWTGNDLRVINVSIRKADGSYMYRTRLEWSTGAALPDTTTTYEIRKKTDIADWEWAGKTTGTITEIEDLSETPIYSFKIRVRTKEGLYSAYSKSVSIKLTKRQYGAGVIGKTGGKIFIEDYDENADNNAQLEIDEGTFREDATIMLEKLAVGEYEISGKKANGLSLSVQDFKKPVTLKLAYKKEEVISAGWNEDNLSIFHFDGVNWISIGGRTDKTNTLVIAKVNHFSKFRIAENTVNKEPLVLPDYFSPNSDGIADAVYFYFSSQDMVEKAEITIYGMDGKRVRIIKPDGSNTLYWNGHDEDGMLSETGLYICVIKSGEKTFTKTVRLVR